MVDDVGKWFHMIHNNLAEGSTKTSVFLKLVHTSPRRTGRTTSFDATPNHITHNFIYKSAVRYIQPIHITHNFIYMYLLSWNSSFAFSGSESQITVRSASEKLLLPM